MPPPCEHVARRLNGWQRFKLLTALWPTKAPAEVCKHEPQHPYHPPTYPPHVVEAEEEVNGDVICKAPCTTRGHSNIIRHPVTCGCKLLLDGAHAKARDCRLPRARPYKQLRPGDEVQERKERLHVAHDEASCHRKRDIEGGLQQPIPPQQLHHGRHIMLTVRVAPRETRAPPEGKNGPRGAQLVGQADELVCVHAHRRRPTSRSRQDIRIHVDTTSTPREVVQVCSDDGHAEAHCAHLLEVELHMHHTRALEACVEEGGESEV
mmetsp:Transcript_28322/g.76292  ORF Transcript_28322/g.76292 Transcript_28322/m.76292 type:complete len:264 (-) Transcript_28322:208-999(-)